MSWNLQSELNTDFSTDSLFDDLPPAPVELTRQGESRTKISDVPRLSSKPLEIGAAGEAFLGAETFGQKQTPKVEAAPVESAPVQEEKEWTLGRWFNTIRSASQKLDSLQKIGDVGPNAARGYNRAYFESLKSALKQHMAERVETEFGYEQPEVMRLYDFLTRDSAGYRSQEDIDEIHSYVKNGVEVNGSFQSPTWEEAVLIQKAQRHERLKEKTTGGLTQEDLTKSMSNLNAAQEAYEAAKITGDPRKISAAKINLDLAEDGTNKVSGGRLYLERHQATQNSILQALKNTGNPKVNWKGVPYDDPSLKNAKDSTESLSADGFVESLVTTGAIPTITRTADGFDSSAAEAYLKKMGVGSTLVAEWQGPELVWYDFDPSNKEKPLVALKRSAPVMESKGGQTNRDAETVSPNESGKRLGAAVKPALQKTANFFKALSPTTDELFNRADYVATGIRNNITAPAVEWAAGVAGQDLDMGRTPNPSIADRDKKQLTAKERAAILSRTQNPLTNLFLNK